MANESTPSITTTQDTMQYNTSSNSLLSHYTDNQIAMVAVAIAIIILCVAACIIGIIFSRKRLNRGLQGHQSYLQRGSIDAYAFDNQIYSTEGDALAMQKAFGTGVLVIQDSPSPRHREMNALPGRSGATESTHIVT